MLKNSKTFSEKASSVSYGLRFYRKHRNVSMIVGPWLTKQTSRIGGDFRAWWSLRDQTHREPVYRPF